MVFVYSEASNSSEQMLRELEEASSQQIPIIMFILDKSEMSDDIRYFVKINQWFDAADGDAEGNYKLLAQSLKHFFPDFDGMPTPGENAAQKKVPLSENPMTVDSASNSKAVEDNKSLLKASDSVAGNSLLEPVPDQEEKRVSLPDVPKSLPMELAIEDSAEEGGGERSEVSADSNNLFVEADTEKRETESKSENGMVPQKQELFVEVEQANLPSPESSKAIDAKRHPLNDAVPGAKENSKQKLFVAVVAFMVLGAIGIYWYSHLAASNVSLTKTVLSQMELLRDAAIEYSIDHEGKYPRELSASFLNYVPVVQIETGSGKDTVKSDSLFLNPFTNKIESPTLGSEQDLQRSDISPGHIVYIPTHLNCIVFSIDDQKDLITLSGKRTASSKATEKKAINTPNPENLGKFQALNAKEPANGAGWLRTGILLALKGEHVEALKCYEKSIKADPTNAIAKSRLAECKKLLVTKFVNQGVDLQEKNDFPAAIASYQKAIDVDSANVVAWLNIAIAYQFNKQNTSARDAYKKVLTLEPTNAQAKQGLESLGAAE